MINLKIERIKRRETQEQFAKFLTISVDSIKAWESDRAKPSYEMIKLLADKLDVTSDYLLEIE